jgi:hypothetical protein
MIVYFYTGEFRLFDPDRGFIDSIKPYIKGKIEGRKQDICHYLSYSTIEAALCKCINEKNIKCLDYLIQSVFLNGGNNESFYHYVPNIINEIIEILHNENRDINTNNYISLLLNSLMIYFNNSISNLRYGDSSWNQSIGNAYDPSKWCYVNSENKIVRANCDLTQFTFEDNQPNKGEGFYLINKEDGDRINLICKIKPYKDYPIFLYTGKDSNGPFLYSSDNNFNNPKEEAELCPEYIYIYYMVGNSWKKLE